MLARRPYNVYNIFFILERARLLQGCVQDASDGKEHDIRKQTFSCEFAGFDQLKLPELPPRYHNLQLPPDWYVPTAGKSSKRKHVATNGLKNFASLAQTVAENWKVVDTVTLKYCKAVAQLIKERHTALTKGGGNLQHHSKQWQKKKKSETTTKLKPLESNARNEVVNHSMYDSPAPSSANIIDIFTHDAKAAKACPLGECDTDLEEAQQQWIDDITSMPFTSSKFLNQSEQTNHLLTDGMLLVEIPTIHPPSPSVVTPLAELTPTIDYLDTDGMHDASAIDFRLF